MSNVITGIYLFKKDYQGIGKKSNKAFRLIELHDVQTLDNTSFFLPEDTKIPVNGFQTRDKVEGSFVMEILYGEPKLVLQSLRKIV